MAQMHNPVVNTPNLLMSPVSGNGFMPENNPLDNQQLLCSAAPGLELLYETCRQAYPQQPNPLQVTAFIKYWYVYR